MADTKFVLLHEGKNDEGIKSFFMEVWELYVKVRPRNAAEQSAEHANDGVDAVEPIPQCIYTDKERSV